MSQSLPSTRLSRRSLYRRAKKMLHHALLRRWTGSRAGLERFVRAFLRGKGRGFLLKLVRQQAVAMAVAWALLAGGPAQASSPIELSDVAAGTGGFVINGIDADDFSGVSVSDAGDVNGDGLADLIVGALFADPGGNSSAGESYVVFGKAGGIAVELSTVAAGTGGFVINGVDVDDRSGQSVSGAGDVNGDGLADLIVGALYADPGGDSSAGESYVVFGKAGGIAVELSTVAAGTGGFVINGVDVDDGSGRSVSGAGDVNGDGLADLIVGADDADPVTDDEGESYVVFGKAGGIAVELSTVAAGTGGFAINGINTNDFSGYSVSGAGDVNGDGLADLIVGAHGGDPGGESYVVFGKSDGTAVELSTVAAGTGGFVINGIGAADESGKSVSSAGDVNGDGLADLVVGAVGADILGGESYVVFGKADGTPVALSAIASGTGGFVITGGGSFEGSGRSVSGAGDVNGDGFAELIIGAFGGIAYPGDYTGRSYVVFGKPGGAPVELSAILAGTGGFVMNSADVGDDSGNSVSGAGDVNGDGLADLFVGSLLADPGGNSAAGESYVVFSTETAPTSATYKAYTLPGDGAGGAIVPETALPDARYWADFSDDSSGDNGSGGASLETVTLHRTGSSLSTTWVAAADSYWASTSDRVGWDSAAITVKYLESEVAETGHDEANVTLYFSLDSGATWGEVGTISNVDLDKNEITFGTISAIGNSAMVHLGGKTTHEKWADFAWNGGENGRRDFPYDTFTEAMDDVAAGGVVVIKGDTATSDTSESLSISKAMTLKASNGAVRIGVGARRDSRGGAEEGFVSGRE